MNKEELSKAARRFVCVLEGFEFKGYSYQHKDNEKDKPISKETYEVRRGPNFIMNADSKEEADTIANKINTLIDPFIIEEFNLLINKFKDN